MSNYTSTTEDNMGVIRTDGTVSPTQVNSGYANEIRKAKAEAWAEGIAASGISLDWQLHLLDHNPYAEES